MGVIADVRSAVTPSDGNSFGRYSPALLVLTAFGLDIFEPCAKCGGGAVTWRYTPGENYSNYTADPVLSCVMDGAQIRYATGEPVPWR